MKPPGSLKGVAEGLMSPPSPSFRRQPCKPIADSSSDEDMPSPWSIRAHPQQASAADSTRHMDYGAEDQVSCITITAAGISDAQTGQEPLLTGVAPALAAPAASSATSGHQEQLLGGMQPGAADDAGMLLNENSLYQLAEAWPEEDEDDDDEEEEEEEEEEEYSDGDLAGDEQAGSSEAQMLSNSSSSLHLFPREDYDAQQQTPSSSAGGQTAFAAQHQQWATDIEIATQLHEAHTDARASPATSIRALSRLNSSTGATAHDSHSQAQENSSCPTLQLPDHLAHSRQQSIAGAAGTASAPQLQYDPDIIIASSTSPAHAFPSSTRSSARSSINGSASAQPELQDQPSSPHGSPSYASLSRSRRASAPGAAYLASLGSSSRRRSRANISQPGSPASPSPDRGLRKLQTKSLASGRDGSFRYANEVFDTTDEEDERQGAQQGSGGSGPQLTRLGSLQLQQQGLSRAASQQAGLHAIADVSLQQQAEQGLVAEAGLQQDEGQAEAEAASQGYASVVISITTCKGAGSSETRCVQVSAAGESIMAAVQQGLLLVQQSLAQQDQQPGLQAGASSGRSSFVAGAEHSAQHSALHSSCGQSQSYSRSPSHSTAAGSARRMGSVYSRSRSRLGAAQVGSTSGVLDLLLWVPSVWLAALCLVLLAVAGVWQRVVTHTAKRAV